MQAWYPGEWAAELQPSRQGLDDIARRISTSIKLAKILVYRRSLLLKSQIRRTCFITWKSVSAERLRNNIETRSAD